MTSAPVPFVPDTAPFSPQQRQWLNGFLAGFFSSSAPELPQAPALEVNVFYASQTGTAERLAKKMAKLLKAEGHVTTVQSVEKLTPAALACLQHCIFFVSTYGEGEPPESARAFADGILADGAPRLDRLRYTVFCLGDRNYEHFCRFGIDLDNRLHALGAKPLGSRIESDTEVDGVFNAWHPPVIRSLREPHSAPEEIAPAPALAEATQVHTRDNPFHAELIDKRLLTHISSSKQTVHISFDLGDGEIRYEAGDACGVLAQNDPALVSELITALPFSATDSVGIPKLGEVAVEDALLHHLQPTRLTRKIVQLFAERTECSSLNALLSPGASTHLDAYIHGRDLLDLVLDYPGVIAQPADLVAALPRLTPRLYSISSSPAAHDRELHCTVGVVRYHAHDRQRGGVASTMLGDRIAVGTRVPLYIQPNKRFRVPADSSAPIIMIGPGTGIAPFRAFLHERRALGHAGRNWLFFGERSAQTDFLYRDELSRFVEDGHLARLDTAFSRDQSHKVYVQDRMIEQGAELFRWLQDGASIYVCGDATRMAKDVDAALHQVLEDHGRLSSDQAQEYITQLNEHHRYHRDVY